MWAVIKIDHKKLNLLKSDFKEAYFALGKLLKVSEKLDDAIDNYKKAYELGINFDRFISEIGDLHLKKGNFFEGIRNLKAGNGYILFDLEKGYSIN